MRPVTKTIEILTPASASTREVAAYCDVSAVTVVRWIKAGCPTVRTRPYLLDLRAVEAWRASKNLASAE